jgi:hypothetical protein
MTLTTATASERKDWASAVRRQMTDRGLVTAGTLFLWLAGAKYQQPLRSLLSDCEHLDPLAGLRMGERLSWLSTVSRGRV